MANEARMKLYAFMEAYEKFYGTINGIEKNLIYRQLIEKVGN